MPRALPRPSSTATLLSVIHPRLLAAHESVTQSLDAIGRAAAPAHPARSSIRPYHKRIATDPPVAGSHGPNRALADTGEAFIPSMPDFRCEVYAAPECPRSRGAALPRSIPGAQTHAPQGPVLRPPGPGSQSMLAHCVFPYASHAVPGRGPDSCRTRRPANRSAIQSAIPQAKPAPSRSITPRWSQYPSAPSARRNRHRRTSVAMGAMASEAELR